MWSGLPHCAHESLDVPVTSDHHSRSVGLNRAFLSSIVRGVVSSPERAGLPEGDGEQRAQPQQPQRDADDHGQTQRGELTDRRNEGQARLPGAGGPHGQHDAAEVEADRLVASETHVRRITPARPVRGLAWRRPLHAADFGSREASQPRGGPRLPDFELADRAVRGYRMRGLVLLDAQRG
jgi:hypothetical protein